MAAVLAFTGVKLGDDVLELVLGTGYCTRVFSQIVRSGGHVYTVWPNPQAAKRFAKGFADWQKRVKRPHYNNVSLLQQPAAMLAPRNVWISCSPTTITTITTIRPSDQ